MAWSTSTRRQRLPDNWPQLRAQVRARAHGRCQATTHEPDCDGIGTDADHIVPGDDHSLANLQWLSSPCHAAKSARESADRNRARAAMRQRVERHPGAISPGGSHPAHHPGPRPHPPTRTTPRENHMSIPIGDPRPAGTEGPAGDQRPSGTEGPAGDPRPAGETALPKTKAKRAPKTAS